MMGVTIEIIILILLMILVLKMITKYSHNMIFMSRYKGQLHGGNAQKKTVFLSEVFPTVLLKTKKIVLQLGLFKSNVFIYKEAKTTIDFRL